MNATITQPVQAAPAAQVCQSFSWGIDAMDDLTGGLLTQTMTVVAGGTGQGKTTLIMSAIMHLVNVQQARVLYVDVELGKRRFFEKMACGQLRVEWDEYMHRDRNGMDSALVADIEAKADQLEKWAKGRLAVANKDGQITIEEVVTWMAKYSKAGYRICVLDYFEAIDCSGMEGKSDTEKQKNAVITLVNAIIKYNMALIPTSQYVKGANTITALLSAPDVSLLAGTAMLTRAAWVVVGLSWMQIFGEIPEEVKKYILEAGDRAKRIPGVTRAHKLKHRSKPGGPDMVRLVHDSGVLRDPKVGEIGRLMNKHIQDMAEAAGGVGINEFSNLKRPKGK